MHLACGVNDAKCKMKFSNNFANSNRLKLINKGPPAQDGYFNEKNREEKL
jgi:hypothetical protein